MGGEKDGGAIWGLRGLGGAERSWGREDDEIIQLMSLCRLCRRRTLPSLSYR